MDHGIKHSCSTDFANSNNDVSMETAASAPSASLNTASMDSITVSSQSVDEEITGIQSNSTQSMNQSDVFNEKEADYAESMQTQSEIDNGIRNGLIFTCRIYNHFPTK